MEYYLRCVLSVVDELVQLEHKFLGRDVYCALDVSSSVVIVADVYDEIVFGLTLDESLELLWGYVLDHPAPSIRISA